MFEMQKTDFKENLILVYCTVGCRSGAYTKKLQKQGFNAFNLYGGVLAWALEGGIFLTPRRSTYKQSTRLQQEMEHTARGI